MRRCQAILAISTVVAVVGCGGSSKTSTPPPVTAATVVATPVFTPAPGTYSTTQSVTIADSTSGAAIYYTTDGTTPTSSSTLYSGAISVSNSQILQAIATATSDTTSDIANGSFSIVPPVVSGTQFDFGQDLAGNVETRTVATITNNGPTAAPVALSLTGDATFSLVSAQSCGATIPANSACAVTVSYTPVGSGVATGAVSVQFTGGPASTPMITLTGNSASISAGTVAPTTNPQVALYTISPPFNASVAVEFGTTTAYGFSTSSKTTPPAGGPVQIQVAGMKGDTVYHMRANVTFEDGTTFSDGDHLFTTGPVPAGVAPVITATTAAGMTPQPGIELINTVLPNTYSGGVATDLAGNVIWTYVPADRQAATYTYPIKPLPNGNFIAEINPVSQSVLSVLPPAGSLITLREFDLIGNTVRELPMTVLNQRLVDAGFKPLNLIVYSHDLALLPNGHMLVVTNRIVNHILGDVVVDLDADWNPVWVWDEFDHLDTNRRPYSFPDWTHTNAIIYSPDDGDFLVSVRHQNWVIKVNYKDGAGDGSIVWKLGYQGDFKLVGGTDPQDWFYAQHNPAFFSTNTSGSYSLGVMDNGDDRIFPDGTNCAVQGGSLCYTTVPIFTLDETAMTATITFHDIFPPSQYSFFAGNVGPLANGNIEIDLAGEGSGSTVLEVTHQATPTTVWTEQVTGENDYRAIRYPSLYPGVSW